MKKMYRRTALCLLVILVLTLTAGCGGSGNGTTAAKEDAGTQEAASAYEVLVTDKDEQPIQGVSIQFCSDTECVMGTTDETGIASFEQEAGAYTIHVLKVPEGYAKDSTEYEAPAEPGLVTIVLEAE